MADNPFPWETLGAQISSLTTWWLGPKSKHPKRQEITQKLGGHHFNYIPFVKQLSARGSVGQSLSEMSIKEFGGAILFSLFLNLNSISQQIVHR